MKPDSHYSTRATPGSSPGGSGGGRSAKPATSSHRKHDSELATEYFAAALGGILVLFILSHWLRFYANKYRIPSAAAVILSPFMALTRIARRIFIRKAPGFPSVGHAALTFVFLAINVIFSFFPTYDWAQPTSFAARFGWMAASNFAVVVLLSLKNTPLALMTSYSYERLNCLHRVAGYTAAVFMILHGTIYAGYFIQKNRWEPLHKPIVTAGIILGFSMFAAVIEAVILRRLQYELFKKIHTILFIAIVVTMALHQPKIEEGNIAIVACITAAIWGTDRVLRFLRLLYNSINNQAQVFPLPNGGTRIVLKKPLAGAAAGEHCYVWLPTVRLFELHPFSIIATAPAELIVNCYSGFTKDLHNYAVKNPGNLLKVALEGPYGKFPDPMDFDKVILISGGSGASFTFGLASNMLDRMDEKSPVEIEFIWVAKTRDHLSWFRDHLNAIRTHTHGARVALKLHTTKSTVAPLSSEKKNDLSVTATKSLDRTRAIMSEFSEPATPVSDGELPGLSDDSEKDIQTVVYRMDGRTAISGGVDLPVAQGRPDVAALIREAVGSVDNNKRVLIAACGPNKLMKVIRNTTATCITREGPAVELHCENFSW